MGHYIHVPPLLVVQDLVCWHMYLWNRLYWAVWASWGEKKEIKIDRHLDIPVTKRWCLCCGMSKMFCQQIQIECDVYDSCFSEALMLKTGFTYSYYSIAALSVYASPWIFLSCGRCNMWISLNIEEHDASFTFLFWYSLFWALLHHRPDKTDPTGMTLAIPEPTRI